MTGAVAVKDVDASAAGAAMELMRQVDVVLETLSAALVPELAAVAAESGRPSGWSRPPYRRAAIPGLILLNWLRGLIASGVPDPMPR